MFNSRFKTEKLEEALDILPELFALANEVLSSSEIDKSDRLSLMLVGSESDKKAAIKELKDMVGQDPKRPLYYANYELGFLPRWTRNAVRYLGDYIDQLCKHWAFLLTENKIWLERSMGQCLHLIKDKVGDKNVKLLNILTEYNHIIYDTAKHDFTLQGWIVSLNDFHCIIDHLSYWGLLRITLEIIPPCFRRDPENVS